MSYRAHKPYGRRKTDKSLSSKESNHWRKIRRDVEEDSSGLIRRYLRLSEKVLGSENLREESDEEHRTGDARGQKLQEPQQAKDRAA